MKFKIQISKWTNPYVVRYLWSEKEYIEVAPGHGPSALLSIWVKGRKDVRFSPESEHFNVAGAYSLLPDDLARDQPVGTAPFGTRSKEILMRCISELKGMVR